MCASNPCLHEGTCIDLDNNSFKCLCKEGWNGQNCEGVSSGCQIKSHILPSIFNIDVNSINTSHLSKLYRRTTKALC